MPDFLSIVAAYFEAHPAQWITAVALERIGGRQAWRSRVSECRTKLAMNIENRLQRRTKPDGTKWTLSEYRYLPPPARAASAEDTPSTPSDRLF